MHAVRQVCQAGRNAVVVVHAEHDLEPSVVGGTPLKDRPVEGIENFRVHELTHDIPAGLNPVPKKH